MVIGALVVAAACGAGAKSASAPPVPTTTTARAPASSSTTSTTDVSQNPRVHVSLIVPPAGIVSGQTVAATLVIRNDSGAPILSNHCVPPGESVLGEVELSTYPPPTMPPPTTTITLPPNASTSSTFLLGHEGGCLGPTHEMVGIGTTRVPFLLQGSTSLCQFAPAAQLQIHACLPGGTPLAPGNYYLDYAWYGPLPTPAITVRVVAPTR